MGTNKKYFRKYLATMVLVLLFALTACSKSKEPILPGTDPVYTEGSVPQTEIQPTETEVAGPTETTVPMQTGPAQTESMPAPTSAPTETTHVHTYTSVVTNPTCTEGGYTTFTCACGDTYRDENTEATGHNYTITVTPPNCTEQGYTTHTCHCGDSYIDSYENAVEQLHVVENGVCTICGLGVEWEYTIQNGAVIIEEYIGNSTVLEIPSSIDGMPVIEIGRKAFYEYTELVSVTIPEGVKTLGEWAFRDCYNLTSVVLPDTLENIGDGAFWNCFKLSDITIPSGITLIGELTFYDTALKSIVIPDSVMGIGESAFQFCESLTEIKLSEILESIGEYAFYGCSSLESIIIPDYVAKIEGGAFCECDGLSSILLPISTSYIGECAFMDCLGLSHVFYKGTEEQWSKIVIEGDNEPMLNTTLHYNCSGDEIYDFIDGSCSICDSTQ